ncbi:hypothetical protein [Thermogemmatispora sp.]|uniref:hypothetical protein n=1 Tax=Thermogemmatispora sp. TaxID=1968838 RepID=UPI0035E43E80
MKSKPWPALLYAAQRAAQRRFFLASALQEYWSLHRLDEQALAYEPGCSSDDLPRLALCRRPAGDAEMFLKDVELLARRFHLKGERLVALLRQVEVSEALRVSVLRSSQDHGLPRAARHGEEGEEEL